MRISDWSSDVFSSDLLAGDVAERGDRILGRPAGGQHHPEYRRIVELAAHVDQSRRSNRPLLDEVGHGFSGSVIDHCVMTAYDQPSRDIAPNAAKADDADLHVLLRFTF